MPSNSTLRNWFPGYDPIHYAADEAAGKFIPRDPNYDAMNVQFDLPMPSRPGDALRNFFPGYDPIHYAQSEAAGRLGSPPPAPPTFETGGTDPGFNLNPAPFAQTLDPGFHIKNPIFGGDPGFDLDALRNQALMEQAIEQFKPAGQSRGPMLAPQQPMLPSPTPDPPALPPMDISPGLDLAGAVMQGPQTAGPQTAGPQAAVSQLTGEQQGALAQGESVLDQIRGRIARLQQGLPPTGTPEPMDPNSPVAQFLAASRAGRPEGMSMGEYGELPPEAQALATRWSSGFNKPDAWNDLIKERGAAITTTGQVIPRRERDYPGIRSLPMGLGDQHGSIDGTGVYLNVPERSQAEKDAAHNIAEENLRKRGYVKGPMGWAPPEVAEARLAEGGQVPSAISPERIQANDIAIRNMENRRHVNRDADGNGVPDWRDKLTQRGQRDGEARRLRMSGMDPRMAEMLAGGGQGGDLYNNVVFGPAYAAQMAKIQSDNRRIDAQIAAADRQIASAERQGDKKLAADAEARKEQLAIERAKLGQQASQFDMTLRHQGQQSAADRAVREKGIATERDIGMARVEAERAAAAGKNPAAAVDSVLGIEDPKKRAFGVQMSGGDANAALGAELGVSPTQLNVLQEIFDKDEWDESWSPFSKSGIFGGSLESYADQYTRTVLQRDPTMPAETARKYFMFKYRPPWLFNF